MKFDTIDYIFPQSGSVSPERGGYGDWSGRRGQKRSPPPSSAGAPPIARSCIADSGFGRDSGYFAFAFAAGSLGVLEVLGPSALRNSGTPRSESIFADGSVGTLPVVPQAGSLRSQGAVSAVPAAPGRSSVRSRRRARAGRPARSSRRRGRWAPGNRRARWPARGSGGR